MKRFFIAAISLSLLLLLAGFAQAAALTVNLVGKYEGNAQVVVATNYSTTPMVIRIFTQSGALFTGNVAFPNQPTWGTTFNGAIFDGGFRITGREMVGDGKYLQSTPPCISGCFQSPGAPPDTPEVTGLFYLKRTSINPNQ